MTDDDSRAERSFGSFQVEEFLGSLGDIEIYRARDIHVDRSVVLRVAGESSAGGLLEDARRIASVSHASLVGVLGANRSESGGYAAAQDAAARPLSDIGPLSSEQAARVAIDIAGAIAALAEAGLRAPVSSATVLVAQSRDGARGLLDPLRALTPGQSCLADANPEASTDELIDLLEQVIPDPTDDLRRALAGVRSGVSRGPAELAGALAALAAPPRTAGRRPPALAAVACLAVVVAGAVAVAVQQRSGGSSRSPSLPRPGVARVVAQIPLGLARDEYTASFTIAGDAAWVATSANRLLRIDAATNQVVGAPLELGEEHPVQAVNASGGKLYAVDSAGWLLRVDPRAGRITGRRHLGGALTAIRAAGDVLWVAAQEGPKGTVMRVDRRTLRPIGAPMPGVTNAFRIEARGSRAWLLGGSETSELARVDAASGARRIVHVGPGAGAIALTGSTLWITDRFNGTVSPLDAERMSFARQAIQAPRSTAFVLAAGSDIWVTAGDGLGMDARLRVERFDSRSGRRAGRAVTIGKSVGYSMKAALGSIWVLTPTGLIRLAPTTPRPALDLPAPAAAAPRTLVPGPLGAGTWRSAAFAAPFTFSPPAFAWLAVFPRPDTIELIATGDRFAELDISAPRQVFTTDKQLRAVGSPEVLLDVLRRDPRLRVGPVRRVVIGGRPAFQFELRVRRPTLHSDVCGPERCVLLFPLQEGTIAPAEDDVARFSLLRSAGRTLVIVEAGNDREALTATESLLRTFHFAR